MKLLPPSIEGRNPGFHNPCFCHTYIQPHGPVTSQRLSHWLKEMLQKAGVDTAVFKAHSVRGASSTAASEKGASMEDILRTADWSTDSTFRRFFRPSHNNSYAQTVLRPRTTEGEECNNKLPALVVLGCLQYYSGLCAIEVFNGLCYHLGWWTLCHKGCLWFPPRNWPCAIVVIND